MAAVVIIGVLAAISLPSFANQINRAKEAQANTYLSVANRAQQAYRLENNNFATSLGSLGLGQSDNNYTYSIAIANQSHVIIEAQPKVDSIKGFKGVAYLRESGINSAICVGTPGQVPTDCNATQIAEAIAYLAASTMASSGGAASASMGGTAGTNAGATSGGGAGSTANTATGTPSGSGSNTTSGGTTNTGSGATSTGSSGGTTNTGSGTTSTGSAGGTTNTGSGTTSTGSSGGATNTGSGTTSTGSAGGTTNTGSGTTSTTTSVLGIPSQTCVAETTPGVALDPLTATGLPNCSAPTNSTPTTGTTTPTNNGNGNGNNNNGNGNGNGNNNNSNGNKK